MKFPNQIFVTQEEDRDSSILLVNESPDFIEDAQPVAVYKLVEVKTLQVTRELV